jgi:hypothetical protein
MVCILLTRYIVHVYQYWMYGRGQEGTFLAWIDQRGCRSSKGVDYDILAQGINRIDRILIPSKYTLFFRSSTTKNSGVKHVWHRAILRWVTDRKVFLGE